MLVGENPTFVGENQDGMGIGMEQDRDLTEVRKQYEEARTWLAVLIDNPDKTVSVADYRKQLQSARRAVSVAHMNLMAAARG